MTRKRVTLVHVREGEHGQLGCDVKTWLVLVSWASPSHRRGLDGATRTKLASVEGILRLCVEEAEAMGPLVGLALSLFVVRVQLALPWPGVEEVGELDFDGCHGVCLSVGYTRTEKPTLSGKGPRGWQMVIYPPGSEAPFPSCPLSTVTREGRVRPQHAPTPLDCQERRNPVNNVPGGHARGTVS